MTLTQIENNVERLVNTFNQEEFVYDFLLAFNAPKSVIQRLKKGALNLSKNADEVVIKKKLFFKVVTTSELATILPLIVESKSVLKNQLRFVLVTDYQTILAIDTKTKEQIEIALTDLKDHVTFFLPLAGMEKYQAEEEKDADVKAATYMAKLFDELKKTNPTTTLDEVHHLNVFLSRLLFCFFAEDTGIFKKDLFTGSIANLTQPDGSDLSDYLERLFGILNTEHRSADTPTYLTDFPYVNGGLFKDNIQVPKFTFKSREAILKSGSENWADINPDIFGSMIQAVVTEDKRGNFGMHYTSVPNIMKLIRPLFLDELEEEFERVKFSVAGLNKLWGRIANIRIFDPACGSGNFLIIAYKQLRYLEIKILLQLKALQTNSYTGFEEKQGALFAKSQLTLADNRSQAVQLEMFSRIELNHFFGIELDDFAHEIAKLSLWLAQHQMNVEFNKVIGATSATLPLRDAGVIVQGNATRLNWEEVCLKPKVGEVFVLGNPPYLGYALQSSEQKEDMAFVFKNLDNYKKLDLIACWFFLGAKFIIKNPNAQVAFVSTNSICQGEQVSILWQNIFDKNLEIGFAHQSFKWKNNAKSNAGVAVVIIGLRRLSQREKRIYIGDTYTIVKDINAYLVAGINIIVNSRQKPLSILPNMIKGSSPGDGGNLILSEAEASEIITVYPDSKPFIKRYLGADEFLYDKLRYCIWVSNNKLELAYSFKPLKERFFKCRDFRLASKKIATQKKALVPHEFDEKKYVETHSILIPQTTSELRTYIPIGFLNSDVVISNAARVIYNADSWVFALLSSRIHNNWVQSVAGRLETRIQYSNTLCYNTFPSLQISKSQKDELEQHTHNVLEQRAKHSEKTLAEMYDPKKMPDGLKEAHHQLDLAVERCYRSKPFESDEERLAYLFNLYEKMIAEEKTNGTLFAKTSKPKKAKKKQDA
jgi:hypothetical protein